MNSGVATAQTEQRQYRSLKDELARIGTLIEDGKRRLNEMQVNEAEESRLLAELPKLRQDERELRDSIARLKGAETEAAGSTQRATKAHRSVDSAYKSVSDLHGKAIGKKMVVERQIESLESDAQSIAASNKEKVRRNVSKTDAALIAANNALAGIQAQIATAKKEIASMSTRRTQSASLFRSIRAQENHIVRLDKLVAATEKSLKGKQSQLLAVAEDIATQRAACDAECAQRAKDIDAREIDLKRREGDIDRVRKWVKDKGGLLKQAKREIEEYRGKVLAHIIIPELDD